VSVASGGGSAAAGADYTALTQTVSWADGDTATKTVALIVSDDDADEPNETVVVTIANPTGDATVGTPASATVTILDDDLPPPGPSTQNVSARGSYGGGAMGWWMVVLAALLVLRRSPAKAGPTPIARFTSIAGLLVLPFVASAADDGAGWYIGVRGGVATSTLSEGDIERALAERGHEVDATVDDSHAMGAVFGGHRWANGFGLEVGYVDLGEYEVELAATTTDPDGLLVDAQAELADAGRGLSAALTWSWALGDSIELTPHVGAYYWESERELRTSDGNLKSEEDGVDATAGITLGWRLSPAWSLGIGWDVWAAGDRNDLHTWSAALTYRFAD
jgi:hypothetical protein